ncbi:MAG: glycosyltransferase family 2 protein, partial [Nitrospinota bacterium]|nr:glycosyltransferase family 2 protein [Nitrospinota bacterium]
LLNNDTLVDPGALGAMVRRVAEKMEYGICGSTLMHYHDPGQIQALGGATYSRLLARPQLFAPALAAGETLAPEDVERRIDYVHGASMLVTRSWIENAGLMSEDYFLYFEELDWIRMAKGKFMIAYAESSVVYHKSGESIGTSSDIKNRSYVCDYYFTRNRLLFTRKYYPLFTPVVCLVLLSDLFRRILRGQPDRARMIASLLWGKNDRGGGRDKR